MIYRSIILVFLSLGSLAIPASSQDLDGLRNERELIDDRIDLLNNKLKEPKVIKTDLLDRYTIIQSKIEQQESLQDNISKEIQALDKLLTQIQSDASAVSIDQQRRKRDLDKLIRRDFYKQLLSGSSVAASSGHELISNYTSRRYQTYLRDRTIADISHLASQSDVISDSIEMIKTIIAAKEELLLKEEDNSKNIQDDKAYSEKTLKSIQADAPNLQEEVSKQIARQERTNEVINRAISAASAEAIGQSGKALDQYGRSVHRSLPWPVSGGVVTRGFGQENYGNVTNLQFQNSGINMICPSGQSVRTVDGGRVIMSGVQPPYGHVIIVNHGDYDSAYFNIDKPVVSANDQVAIGDYIGSLEQNEAGSEFYFEIWYRHKQIDPLQWLIKR